MFEPSVEVQVEFIQAELGQEDCQTEPRTHAKAKRQGRWWTVDLFGRIQLQVTENTPADLIRKCFHMKNWGLTESAGGLKE